MAKSNKQIEQEVLALLDSQGISSKDVFELEEFPPLNKYLVLSAANFVLKVQKNLRDAKKIDTGRLSSDIESGDVDVTESGLSITVGYPEGSEANNYADFVNKGVKGAVDKRRAPGSPYSFKNQYPNKKMALQLAKWYRRQSISAKKETKITTRRGLQKKRQSLSTMASQANSLKSLAYATAANIKKKGLRKTGFFDKAVDSTFNEEFKQAIANITGLTISLNIQNKYGNNDK